MAFCWDTPDASVRPVLRLALTSVDAFLIYQVSIANTCLGRCLPSSPGKSLQGHGCRGLSRPRMGQPHPCAERILGAGRCRSQAPGPESKNVSPLLHLLETVLSDTPFHPGVLFPTERPGPQRQPRGPGSPVSGCRTHPLTPLSFSWEEGDAATRVSAQRRRAPPALWAGGRTSGPCAEGCGGAGAHRPETRLPGMAAGPSPVCGLHPTRRALTRPPVLCQQTGREGSLWDSRGQEPG